VRRWWVETERREVTYQEERSDDYALASVGWADGSDLDNLGIIFVRRRDAAFSYCQLPDELIEYFRPVEVDSALVREQMKAFVRLIKDSLPRLRFRVDPIFGRTARAEGSEPEWLGGIIRYLGYGLVGIDIAEFAIPAGAWTVTTEGTEPERKRKDTLTGQGRDLGLPTRDAAADVSADREEKPWAETARRISSVNGFVDEER
jgi:hypothetical protein